MSSSIRDMAPEAYAEMLRGQGVPEGEIHERMAHALLTEVQKKMKEDGVPPGYEGMAQDLDAILDETLTPRERSLTMQIQALTKEVMRIRRQLSFWISVLKIAMGIAIVARLVEYFL